MASINGTRRKTAVQQYGMETGAPGDALRITALVDYVSEIRSNG